jgi:hypothetical protein
MKDLSKENKQIREIMMHQNHFKDSYAMYRYLNKDECKIPLMPFKYYNLFGLEKRDLLGSLLESYHQARLKDEL